MPVSPPLTPAERVRAYLEDFRHGDPELVARHVTEDFVNEHTAALGTGCVGRDVYRERLGGFLAEMVGLSYEIEDMVSEGERVIVTYRMRARWQGDAPLDIRGAQRLVVRDGLIAHRTDYWDSASFLVQADPGAAAALARYGIS